MNNIDRYLMISENAKKWGIIAFSSLDETLPEVDVVDNCTAGTVFK
jgi:hypothetical protein